MRQFGIPRNMLRDYNSICKLKIIDAERYKRVVEAEREKVGKVLVKCIVLNEYRGQQATATKKTPSFLPEGRLILPKVNRKTFLNLRDKNIFCNKQLAVVWFNICVDCNFNDNRVMCYIKTQLKYQVLSYLTEVLNFTKNVIFRKPTFNGLLFERLLNAPTKL